MSTSLFHGTLVRLAAVNPETDAEVWARWTRDELRRNGQSWDTLYMGILRDEWEKSQAK